MPAAERARTSFQQGMEAYRQNRFRAAIERFKEADRLAPSARLSFNIALAYERMNDGPNALAAYRDYLRRSPKAENADTTSVRIAELELQLQKSGVQQLSIMSTPAGALVFIDDVSRGVTPWTGELAPGAHRLTLRVRGYEDSAHTFDMSARHSMDLTYELRPVVSPPPGVVAAASSAGSALAASSAAAPYETLPEVEQGSTGVRWWTWTGLGTSAALLVGSGVLELTRRGLESDARDELVQVERVRKWHEMDDRKELSRVILGVGAAVGVLSGVSLYFDLGTSRSESTDIGLACEGGDCQLRARGTW